MTEKNKAKKGQSFIKDHMNAFLKMSPENVSEISTPDIQELMLELQNYQYELEEKKHTLKKSNRELKASLSYYLDFFNLSPIGHLSINMDGFIVEANPAAVKMLGIDENHQKDLAFSDFIDKGHQNRFNSHCKKLIRKKEQISFELKLKKERKHQFFAELDCHPLFNKKGECTLFNIFLVDIASRKQTEQVNKESDIKYQKIVELSPDLIVIYDFEGNILYMNVAGLNMLRISHLDQILDSDIKDLMFFKEGSDNTLSASASAFQNDRHKLTECTLKRSDGTTIPAEFSQIFFYYESKPAYQIFARNISKRIQAEEQRKEAEDALIKSEKQYHDLFFWMLDGFAVHEMIYDEQGNPCDYRFLKVNPAFEQLTGLKAKDIIGKRAREVIPGLEKRWIERYADVVLTGTPQRFEDHAEELHKTFEVYVYRPQADQFACVFQNITERKEAEEALQGREKKYKTLIKNIPGMVYLAKADWSTEIISGSKEICGYTVNEINTKKENWLSIIHPDDKEKVYKAGLSLLKKPVKKVAKYRIMHKNGDIRWIEDRKTSLFNNDGTFHEIDGIVFDITDHMQTKGN